MTKILSVVLFLVISFSAIGQTIGRVNKKTKEFTVAADQKAAYTVFGYQYPNITTKKVICFSSSENMVREENPKCLLGAYFDTDKMKVGDKILYVGVAGSFARMKYVTGSGKSMLFYLPKSSFAIK
ncbi:MAG: hypothetical protein J0H74_19785 [Chitinophagaceae bacterium]|nr:hypothetical protein [Chitinophagaceae bacterium]